MCDWVKQVGAKWKTEGVKINKGASLDEIETVEQIVGFTFPSDFKDFYLAIDGFDGLDWQEHMFYFWPLSRLVEEYNEGDDKDFIGFCDFLLASHYIGFRKSKEGIFKIYPSVVSDLYDGFGSIANTFEAVVSMINSNNESIY